jgi:hypothetical protein
MLSFGDCCLTPANEDKTIVSMYQYESVISTNLLKALEGKSDFASMPKEFMNLIIIPLGSKMGFSAFNGF